MDTSQNVKIQLLTVEQVADRLQVSFHTVIRYIKDSKLKTVSFGSDQRPRKRISIEELERFIGEGENLKT